MRLKFDIGRREPDQGFSLVEVLVAVVLLAVFLLGMVQFFASAADRVMDSETRALLHQIASEQIESIRALPYEDIGTVGGHPSGSLEDVLTETVRDVPVEITREIVYVEDPSYSGPYPANYRRVTVIVRATDSDELEPMQLSTLVAGGADGGSLDITVTDLAGTPVADARLRVVNTHLSPDVDINSSAIRTDIEGHLLVPGLPPDGTNSYYVTASKPGYSSAATQEGLVVKKGTPFTVVQLVIDRLAGLTIRLTDETGTARAGVSLTITGYQSVSPWIYSAQVVTDAGGYASLSNLRYSTSLQPYTISTTAAFDPVLRLPTGVDADPVDAGIPLGAGEIGIILDPGDTRTLQLVLPNS